MTDHKTRIKHLRDNGMKWREIAALPEYKSIPAGSLCAFYKGTWEPKDNKVRHQLGLPQIIKSVAHRNNLGRFMKAKNEKR